MLCKKCSNLGVVSEASVLVKEFYKGKFVTKALLCTDCLNKFKKEIPENEQFGYSYKFIKIKIKERVLFT